MRKFWFINALLFQIAWLVCAFLNSHASSLLLIILLVHFALSNQRIADTCILLLAPIGWLLDSTLIYLNVFSAQQAFMPVWLMLLWCLFVLTLNHSLSWLSSLKLIWVALCGAIAGPLSYFSAIKLGVLASVQTDAALLTMLSLAWAILLPLFIYLQCSFSPALQQLVQRHD